MRQVPHINTVIVLYVTLQYSFVHCTDIVPVLENVALKCLPVQMQLTQTVENEGFHKDIKWLIEYNSNQPELETCSLMIRMNISAGLFVNPDQIADLNRLEKISAYIEGDVNVEAAAHEATPHTVNVFVNNRIFKRKSEIIVLPVHLRYQRSQINGGFGKIPLEKPHILIKCNTVTVCGKGKSAPCDETGKINCTWTNLTFDSHFDDLELFVPIGDLDDYPLVSIISLLLGCSGCIYILSILSTTKL